MAIKEALQQIKALIAEKNWKEAHRACLEVLRFDPDNVQVIRQKNYIEREVKKQNIKTIKEDIQRMKKLLKEKNYKPLLTLAENLNNYRTEYPPLARLLRKIARIYDKELQKQKNQEHQKELEQVEAYIQEKEYQKALRTAQHLRITGFRQSEVKKMVQKVKDAWIQQELAGCKNLLESEKYEEALITLQQLKKIDSKSKLVESLMQKTKKRAEQNKIIEKRDFLFKAMEKIKTLMQLKKYDHALRATHEVLAIDAHNNKAQKIFAKATHKVKQLINKELYLQMKKAHQMMAQKYKKEKSSYIKI